MESLEYLYDKAPKIENFSPRKVQIEDNKTLLVGSKQCGISSNIFDYLDNFEKNEYLYVDLSDERIDKKSVFEKLKNFVETKPIKILIIENFSNVFELPNIEKIILSSNDMSLHVEGFSTLHVEPLDFEEYIAFDTKHSSISHLFDLYAKHGRLPSSVQFEDFANIKHLQESLRKIFVDTLSFEIFKMFALSQSTQISLHVIYKTLKEKMKISKDKLYKVSEELQNQDMIRLIKRYDSPKANKKVFLTNFAYKNALTFERDFQKRFQNIVFCELTKTGEEIFYTNDLDFYIPSQKKAILCIPFTPPELIARRFTKIQSTLKSLHVNNLSVITVGNEGLIKKEGITCEILPFWNWALQF